MQVLVKRNSARDQSHEIFITADWGVAFDVRLVDGKESQEEVRAIIMANWAEYGPRITWDGWSN